ncbi:MAG TPA: CvpA family protein [Xanthobacteraceae bacterium]|jgi:membrane protein required for colicin V production|nr:CvpA family protein [Xanthobacteraceae bacterium]
MNPFDAAVTAAVILGLALGFMSGLLRSLATILAYLIAAPVAIALAPNVASLLMGNTKLSPDMTWLPLFAIFIVIGVALGAIFRSGVNGVVGSDPHLLDRLGGALLGVVRMLFAAVLVVVIFDRMIPPDREPPYLASSKLRPYLSAAGQKGLASLPPEAEDYIDRVKRERGL